MQERNRRTKIVATLGPATDDLAVLEDVIVKGVDVVRLNFSHGTANDHVQRCEQIRTLSKKHGRHVAVLADLQGPKIRIAKFEKGSVELKQGASFSLDCSYDKDKGNDQIVGVDYKSLHEDLNKGDVLLLDDGRITLEVTDVIDKRIACIVLEGGTLSNNKGINKQGGGLSAPCLTDKDKSDLKVAHEAGVEYIAISFARDAKDVVEARNLLNALESNAGIVTKIERADALQHIDAIIKASDAVMVARGDLGVEIGDAELPRTQKEIIGRARALDKAVITATQMMESMIENSMPTRAEVFDVANAVLDGTDAVMLSAETAAGKNPGKVVEAMSRICLGAERHRVSQVSGHRLECTFEQVDEAIAMATMYTANHLDVKGIISLTESGRTPLWMSRIRSGIPIYGLCRDELCLRRMSLYRGVYPVFFDVTKVSRTDVNRQAVQTLVKKGIVHAGDRLILTKGDFMGVHGGSNTMKIVHVGTVL